MSADLYFNNGIKKLIRLHPFGGAVCGCGWNECKLAGKHPTDKGWQNNPVLSDKSFNFLNERGRLNQFGVLLTDSGLVVIDEDPRNGGSIDDLSAKVGINLHAACGFTVRSGSGGHHLYFKAPQNMPDLIHGKDGIDYKKSGFVVGAGSPHKSGGVYEAIKGTPADIVELPIQFIEYAKKRAPERTREARAYEKNDTDIREILSHIDPDLSYEDWLRVGMALHTDGHSVEEWIEWSRNGTKFKGEAELLRKWKGFKGGSVTLGTLIHIAKENGYTLPQREQSKTDCRPPEPPFDPLYYMSIMR